MNNLKLNFKNISRKGKTTLRASALAGLFFMCMTACENDLSEVRRFGYYEEVPTEIAKDVEIMYSDSMQVRVIVRTPRLVRFSGNTPREEFLGGIQVDFLGDNLKTSSRLTAKKAIKETVIHKDEKDRPIREPAIFVQDSVVLTSSGGRILKTTELVWYEDTGRLKSDKFVQIITPTEIIYGYGFETDKEFSKWKLTSPAGSFPVNSLQEDF